MRYISSKINAGTILMFLLVFILLPWQAAAEGGGDRLVGDLQSSDKAVRSAAIDELGKIKDRSSVVALIGVFNSTGEDWKLQIKALDALAASGAPMVTDTLMDALVNF